jgi:hypothetical protein
MNRESSASSVTLSRSYWDRVRWRFEVLYATLRERERELESARRECARLREERDE